MADLDQLIDSAIAPADEVPEARVQNSEWLVTVNTNQKYSTVESLHQGTRVLYLALQYLISEAGIREFVEVIVPLDSFDGDVGRVTSAAVIENAKSGLHAHIQIKACHTTRLRLNLAALRAALNARIDPQKSVYVNVRVVKNQTLAVRNYIYKNVRGKRLRMCDGEDFPDSPVIEGTLHIAQLQLQRTPA